jgi:hypothetical protein
VPSAGSDMCVDGIKHGELRAPRQSAIDQPGRGELA